MAKITIAQLQTGIAQFIESEVVPNIPPQTFFPFGKSIPIQLNSTAMQFLGGVGVAVGTVKIEQWVPTMTAMGIIGEDGMIDIDNLAEIMTVQMERVGGKLPIGPFTFGAGDIEKIKAYATSSTVQL